MAEKLPEQTAKIPGRTIHVESCESLAVVVFQPCRRLALKGSDANNLGIIGATFPPVLYGGVNHEVHIEN